MLINSRLDSHNQRIVKVEEAVVIIAKMGSDISWISQWVQKQMHNK